MKFNIYVCTSTCALKSKPCKIYYLNNIYLVHLNLVLRYATLVAVVAAQLITIRVFLSLFPTASNRMSSQNGAGCLLTDLPNNISILTLLQSNHARCAFSFL